MSEKDASQLGEYVADELEELCDNRIDFEVPNYKPDRIPQLPVQDGFKCVLDSDNCQHIHGVEKQMQEHCRIKHNWTRFKQRGRPTTIEKLRAAKHNQKAWKIVKCQRFFKQGTCSGYFEVHDCRRDSGMDVEGEIGGEEVDNEKIWAGIKREAMSNFKEIKKEMKTRIGSGEIDKVNR